MLESVTLAHVILLEIIAVLLLGVGLLWFLYYRLRRAHKRLQAELQRMRQTIRVGSTPLPEIAGDTESDGPYSVTDPVAEYLYQSRETSRKRYHNITQSRVPTLVADAPFNAKVAALRYLFAGAESEAYRQIRSARDPWIMLERNLYDVARWIIERQEPGKDKNLSNQMRLLQQRVQALKPYKAQAETLERKLELAQGKLAQLKAYQDESQATIDKLRQINFALSQTDRQQPFSAAHLRQRFTVPEGNDRLSTESSGTPLDNLDQLSAQYQRLNGELTAGVRQFNSDHPVPQESQLENLVLRLESELGNSQRYIETLKERLSTRAIYDETLRGQDLTSHPRTPLMPAQAAELGNIKDTLTIIHANPKDSPSVGNRQKPAAPPKEYSLTELNHLRSNNQQQRGLILDLEKELQVLRTSISDSPEGEVKDAKVLEMLRLERLVQECEYCISALESEVELLYSRLQNRESASETAPEGEAPIDNVAQLGTELEQVTHKLQDTLLESRKDAIVNRFAQEIMHTHSLEDLATCLVSVIKDAELTVGFYMQSRVGKAEFYRGEQFTDRERGLIKTATIAAPVAYLNEGIFFASNHMHLLLKEPPEDDRELAQSEALLNALLSLSSARIHYLEVAGDLADQGRALETWSSGTRENLGELEIRYAYQAEEVQRQLKVLGEELHQLSTTLELGPNARTAIENALSECKHGINDVFNGDQSLDPLCNHLLEQLDVLPKPGH